jgi:hypothetical protein
LEKRQFFRRKLAKFVENGDHNIDPGSTFLSLSYTEICFVVNSFVASVVCECRSGLPDGTYIFKPKIPIWVNFGGPGNGKG